MFLAPDALDRVAPMRWIPPWDQHHQLPISGMVGPRCADSGTVFCINSTYMDVSDASYVPRASGLRMLTPLGMLLASVFWYLVLMFDEYEPGESLALVAWVPALGALCYLVCLVATYGLFGLSRHPVRFNRRTRSVHMVRRRRWFACKNEGDVTWSAPWNDETMFCIHRRDANGTHLYYIRYYALDTRGRIVRACCIGREWGSLEGLLAQWSYWCRFMNHGPESLPRPRLFLHERERLWESYVISQCGRVDLLPLMLMMAPFTLALTLARRLWLLTCRAPRWPAAVEEASAIDADDPFDQPQGATPVGFVRTRLAVLRGRHARQPFYEVREWTGERDPALNAKRWRAERPGKIAPFKAADSAARRGRAL